MKANENLVVSISLSFPAKCPPLPIPRVLLGCLALLAIGLGAAFGVVPLLLAAAFGLLSLLSYLMYSLDKAAARADAQRIPENTLHLVDLLGGWPGALIAQQRLRHKTIKASFQCVFWCSVLGNLAIATWLLDSDIARSVTEAVL